MELMLELPRGGKRASRASERGRAVWFEGLQMAPEEQDFEEAS